MVGSAVAHADEVRLVPADDSMYTQVCLSAAESDAALRSTVSGMGLDSGELESISCNGMPLPRFARQHRDVAYDFKLSDRSAETRLCHAAITAPETFESIRAEHFSNVPNIGQEVSCNGMTLERFVSRYGSVPMVTAAR